MNKKQSLFFSITALFVFTLASCSQPPEQKTAAQLARIQNDPQALYVFLDKMPKGGELHYHLSGGSYAKNLFQYGLRDPNICFDPTTSAVSVKSSCPEAQQLPNILNSLEYGNILNAWSMRTYSDYSVKGHYHFFNIFERIAPIVDESRGDILAEELNRAADQHENYMELMVGFENGEIAKLTQNIAWPADYKKMETALDEAGIDKAIKTIKDRATHQEESARKIMACHTSKPQPGCHVQYRYLYYGLRILDPKIVFAQLYAAFKLAQIYPDQFVGVNIVGAEDNPIAPRDYKLHMSMITYLKKQFPDVHISLHAGELTRDLVPPEDLRFHVRDAIDAGADRIGHGVDIAQERDADALLKEMAKNHKLVEVNLTSNAKLLGVEGKHHPLPLLLKYGVPVALSTDDEGILRTDLTHEYVRAISTYHLTYPQVKDMVRNVLSYSFLRGESLWNNFESGTPVSVCAESLKNHNLDSGCQKFLDANKKAQNQWNLEKEFWGFETGDRATVG